MLWVSERVGFWRKGREGRTVCDDDVEAAESRGGVVNPVLEVFFGRHVHGGSDGLGFRWSFGAVGVAVLVVLADGAGAVGDVDALFEESLHDDLAHAAGAAGDDGVGASQACI